MTLHVIGMNHKTAPITVREKFYFPMDKLPLYLQDLLNQGHAKEAILLSTCNRSELYCDTDNVAAVKMWFCAQASTSPAECEESIYCYRDEEAVSHIMQVACGLDSMILGEPQIFGQMKEAFSESCTAGTVGTSFHRLFQQVFTVAKEIRTTTAIGACPVSVASAAAHFVRQHLPTFSHANVLLLGAGDTAMLLLRYLAPHLGKPITIVNRSMEKAMALTQEYGGKALQIEQLGLALQEADVVFAATGSAMPLISCDLLKSVMAGRAEKPLFIMDIAVPRDVDPAAAAVPEVQLYCVDDLKAIIETHWQGREHAAIKARDMIRQKASEFMMWLASLDTVAHTIRAYRSQIEEICGVELAKAQQQLYQGEDPSQVLNTFAEMFTKKLLHTPSVQLRQAGAEGRFELLRFAKQLFAIPDPEAEWL